MKYILFFMLLFPSVTSAIGPQRFDIDNFFPDAKFIGVVKILSGEASQRFKSNDSCSVTYHAKVKKQILGEAEGKIINLHQIIDYRFPPLEVGSQYFVYAENRDKHSFITLGDAIDLSLYDDQRPEFCHSQDSLYIYREFTHKIYKDNEFSWIGSIDLNAWSGIRQINEIRREAKRLYYSSNKLPPYFIGEPGLSEEHIEGQGLDYDSTITIFEKYYSKYKKAKNL